MKEPRHPLEWVLLAVSTVVVLAVFAYLGFLAVREQRRGEMPILEITCSNVATSPDGQYRVLVKVKNRGLGTAEHIHGEVALEGATPSETVQFELDRLASEASRGLFVLFQGDPRQEGRKLRGRVTSFQVP